MRHSIFNSLSSLSLLLVAGSVLAAPPQIATLAVEKMTCGTCPVVVKKALTRVPGVTSTTIDLDAKTATARLTQATTEAGFPSKLIAKQ